MNPSVFTYMRKFCNYAGWTAALVLLSACVGGDMSDLEAKVAEVKNRKNLVPPPLPEFPPERIYLYPHEEGKARDPFGSLIEEKKTDPLPGTLPEKLRPECKPPDLYRNPEPLEQFPLDALAMVGTLNLDGQIWGLIKSPPPEQLIHRVQVNNYIGQNKGKVIYIGDQQIDLMEKVDDGTGCFQEKENSLKMPEKQQ